jgi:hypothetical protein
MGEEQQRSDEGGGKRGVVVDIGREGKRWGRETTQLAHGHGSLPRHPFKALFG